MFLTDLTFIDDGNPDDDAQGTFSVSKAVLNVRVIRKILRFGRSTFAVQRDPVVLGYLFSLNVLSEEECFRRSRQYEERQG